MFKTPVLSDTKLGFLDGLKSLTIAVRLLLYYLKRIVETMLYNNHEGN